MQKLLVVLLSVLALSSGHAVLRTPRAWNTAASKSNPCGGGTAPTQAAATWVPGSTINISWQVQAGDGTGDVFVTINTGGGTAFNGQATKIGTANSVSTFTFPFTVPNVQCTGANGLCSVQVKSSSNWFSCTSVKIGANTPTPAASTTRQQQATSATRAATSAAASTTRAQTSAAASTTRQQQATSAATSAATSQVAESTKTAVTDAPPTPQEPAVASAVCIVPTNLVFCDMVNGNNVTISSGENPANVDATARNSFNENINNANVFATPTAPGCAEAFKLFTCANFFPFCGAEVACQPQCLDAITKCTIQDSHKGLFDCKQGSPNVCLAAKQGTGAEVASDVSRVFVGASLLLALLM
eukprot:TRINITY_DN480_c0_g1_i1.p1 TRINITY_DN480_c0_g1~~TRINITY_DN480_c0_g1_i1.p1  ORF type:complete len:392 (+),score=124.58 TRINITY_DN480_c0_g1_i1:104-1177(+)